MRRADGIDVLTSDAISDSSVLGLRASFRQPALGSAAEKTQEDAHMNVTLSATTFDTSALSPVIPVRRNRSGEARDWTVRQGGWRSGILPAQVHRVQVARIESDAY